MRPSPRKGNPMHPDVFAQNVIAFARQRLRENVTRDPISDAAQEIHVASGDLLDLVRLTTRPDRLVTIHTITVGLRQRLEAVEAMALQRLDALRQETE